MYSLAAKRKVCKKKIEGSQRKEKKKLGGIVVRDGGGGGALRGVRFLRAAGTRSRILFIFLWYLRTDSSGARLARHRDPHCQP